MYDNIVIVFCIHFNIHLKTLFVKILAITTVHCKYNNNPTNILIKMLRS